MQSKGSVLNGFQCCQQPPQGLEAISKVCRELYPNQKNPLQVTALVKYWLGGADPLDYITIYSDISSTPPHWLYVSSGFSDLHGDGRVHERSTSPDSPSGFGFELTFRLCCYGHESQPPTWPAELLQSLARYVFSSGNLLCVGDHISWHSPLDQQESRIQHMLLASEPRLPPAHSALGRVQFILVVGVTAEEVTAAQAWNGNAILKLLKKSPVCGELLVTDMRRGESLFEAMPEARGLVDEGVASEGSLLSGVSAVCAWEQEVHSNSTEHELAETVVLQRVHLHFNMEALQLWPLAIKGRLNHGRHFTFRNLQGDMAITLMSDGVEGALASQAKPFMAHGAWLQVYLSQEKCKKVLVDIDAVLNSSQQQMLSLPVCLEWHDIQLKMTVS